jgi:hypothetical protein
MEKRKKPEDYPQLSYRVSAEEKQEIDQLLEELVYYAEILNFILGVGLLGISPHSTA